MANVVILIGATADDVRARAALANLDILGEVYTFDTLNKDAVPYHPPYFAPPLGHVQTGQPGAVAFAAA